METYVLRVYRFGDEGSRQLFGLVEFPCSNEREVFTSMSELWLILASRRNEGMEAPWDGDGRGNQDQLR